MSRGRATALALLLLLWADAAGANTPDAAAVARVGSVLANARRVRLSTVRGAAIVSETRATSAGVEYQYLLSSQRSDTLRSPGLVGWEEIQGIDASGGARPSRFTPGRLALFGALVGLGVGTVGAFGSGWINAGGTGFFLFPFVGAGLGYGTGRVIDPSGNQWRPVYP